MHDALHHLGIPTELERVILVNGADASPDRRLVDADIVDVFPPLAGGIDRMRRLRCGDSGLVPLTR